MSIDLKNKKLLKEWEKIKVSDIFASFEDFAEFYYTNGEKPCFRINTNEPWSKDNFFFGEYSELLVYYKEEQPKKRIGQRFHSLTVLDVFWQEKDGKDTLFAKCKCDCGNETIKAMDALTKGNARSCGCKKGVGRKTSGKSIYTIPEDILTDFWDYEKNDVDPSTIAYNSTQKFWWKNKSGKSFQLAPFVFVKPETQTSFPEQVLYHCIKDYFDDSINKAQYITQLGEVLEIDIYIPTLKIGIEYDGSYWHKDRIDSDSYKNKALNEDGIYIIRIREEGLQELCKFEGDVIIRRGLCNYNSLIFCINEVLKILSRKTGQFIKSVSVGSFYAIKEIIEGHTPRLLEIKDTCLGAFWDFKKNLSIKIEDVKLDSTIPVWFSCKAGRSFEISPAQFYQKLQKTKQFNYSCTYDDCRSSCIYTQCCPFMNANICSLGHHCLVRNNHQNPILRCRNRNIYIGSRRIKQSDNFISYRIEDGENYKWVYKEKVSLLSIIFDNKSSVPFSLSSRVAFVIKDKVMRYNGEHFSVNTSDKTVDSEEKLDFDFIITKEIQKELLSSTLLIGTRIFKEEYMKGWFYYLFLILKIDADGNIESQKSKLFSSDDFKDELDIFRSHSCNLKKALEIIIDEEIVCIGEGERYSLDSYDSISPYYDYDESEMFAIEDEDEDEENDISVVAALNAFSLSVEKSVQLLQNKESSSDSNIQPKKTISYDSKNTKKSDALNTVKTIFNELWIFAKGLFRVLWQVAQVLFVIATLVFAFLDGLFFHKIRMQGIRKKAAQKAAQTRKRNAPYKPSKRSRHYNLK